MVGGLGCQDPIPSLLFHIQSPLSLDPPLFSSLIHDLDDPQDSDGNWIPAAIPTVIDLVGAAAILSQEGDLKVSAYMDITYLSPAKIDYEVEVDARVVGHKGMVSAVLVELRKTMNGGRVALGKLWMASGRPLIKSSKL